MRSAATKHLPSPPEQVLKSFISIAQWQAHWSTMISESELQQKAPAEVYPSLRGSYFFILLPLSSKTAAYYQKASRGTLQAVHNPISRKKRELLITDFSRTLPVICCNGSYRRFLDLIFVFHAVVVNDKITLSRTWIQLFNSPLQHSSE